jgi:putative endonuclease
MRAKDAVGKYGERVAARHLVDAGLTVLETNWRCAAGEIDIVAVDGSTLVFCEVKTRSSVAFGFPAEAVTWAKQRRMRDLARLWLMDREEFWPGIRFDVVSVLRSRQGAASVEHLRDVLS